MKWLLFICCFFFACKAKNVNQKENNQEIKKELTEALIGKWSNVSMKVEVNTEANGDSSYVITANEDNWLEKLKIRPIITHFKSDNTYYSEYRNIQDSIVNTSRGIWNTFGDSLMMIESNATYQYEVKINGNKASFYAELDWDNDGQKDDTYFGVQRKLNE